MNTIHPKGDFQNSSPCAPTEPGYLQTTVNYQPDWHLSMQAAHPYALQRTKDQGRASFTGGLVDGILRLESGRQGMGMP